MTRILMVQEGIPDYRVSFFNALSEKLLDRNLELDTVTGRLSRHWLAQGYSEGIHEVTSARVMEIVRISRRVFWMKGLKGLARNADLIILGQANGFLNATQLLLGIGRRNGRPRVALWGHGATMQKTASGFIGRRLKQFLATRADWWFAYTDSSARVIRDYGFPTDRITIVNNAVDTASVRNALMRISTSARDKLFCELFGTGRTGREIIGVFCGRLVHYKRLGLLLDAATMVHDAIPEFKLIIVGGGPESAAVADFCATHVWCRMTGVRHGDARVPYLALADVMLNPGAIGLAVLDAFAAGLPVITTMDAEHGPEFCYLRDGSNGLVLPSHPASYAEAVTSLLLDSERMHSLKRQAALDSLQYSVEGMADRFAAGVTACLAATFRA